MNTRKTSFALYKELVAEYARRIKELQERHGEISFLTLPTHDYNRLHEQSEALKTVEKVLGLSIKEINAVEKANGLKLTKPAAQPQPKKGVSHDRR